MSLPSLFQAQLCMSRGSIKSLHCILIMAKSRQIPQTACWMCCSSSCAFVTPALKFHFVAVAEEFRALGLATCIAIW